MPNKFLKNNNGQVMLLSVMLMSGVLLSATAIAGVLTLYQIKSANDGVGSAKAFFAADAGIEAVSWCVLKDCSGTPYANWTNGEVPINFGDSTVRVEVVQGTGGGGETLITARGYASAGKIIRVLEAVFSQ